MPRASEKLTENRKEEIINACARLYETLNFQEITIKEISKETSLSRPSIYNYFETKEEIFLALLCREYNEWSKDLFSLSKTEEKLDASEFLKRFSQILEKRIVLLKITAMNLYEIEEHSRFECLVEYKQVFFYTMKTFVGCIKKFFPAMTENEIEDFRYAFFPFIYGIYPYVYPTKKQCRAMDTVGINYKKTTVFEITQRFLKQLLK